jgi:nucleotidyltransferase substrate binding protein, HI0074 family
MGMDKERVNNKLRNYSDALMRLKEALEADASSNPFVYDAAIQRFEFTYELSWKLLKSFLEYEGMAMVNLPRAAIKEAFAAGLVGDAEIWADMIDARNLTAHTYDQPKAIEIYNKIKSSYFPQLACLLENINKAITP